MEGNFYREDRLSISADLPLSVSSSPSYLVGYIELGWWPSLRGFVELDEHDQVGDDGPEEGGQAGPVDAEEAQRLKGWLSLYLRDVVPHPRVEFLSHIFIEKLPELFIS